MPSPDPTPSDLHAMNILIESAATDPDVDAIARAIVDEHMAERQPADPTEISITWQHDADGRVFTHDFDAVMFLVDRFQDLRREHDTWRLAAARWCHAGRWWPWVAAGLLFGWGMTVWGWITA